jgi:hypothetical protein
MGYGVRQHAVEVGEATPRAVGRDPMEVDIADERAATSPESVRITAHRTARR